MIKSRTESFGWILPCLCVAYSIVWFSWECHAQGSVPDPANGIVINLTTYNMNLTAGDTLNITAYYLSSPPAHYAIWFKDNVPIVSYNISTNIVGRYLPCPPFVLRNVSCSDAGIYRLFVNNSLGSHFSNPLTVCIIIPNNVPYDPYENNRNYCCYHAPFCRPVASTNRSSTQTNIFIQEGRSERFLVDVRVNPDLTFADWFYNTDLVDRSDPRYIDGDADNPSLLIQPVERTDAGIYSLYANNSIGPLRTPDCVFNLTVGYPPELNCSCNMSECLVVNETESCYFPVDNIDAYPPVISVQWYKSGNPITTPGGRYQDGTISTPSLTVVDTNRNDSGNYNISVSNILGTGQCACCCIVQYVPVCILLSNSTMVVNEFSTFTINVILESLPPADTVGWTKNGSPVNRTVGRFLNGDSYAIPSLTIRNATRRDTGFYVINATNIVGNIAENTNCSVNVTIQYLPFCILLSNPVLVVDEFSTFTINVILESVPPAHIVGWTKDDIPITRTGGRFLNGNSYSTPSLTIRNVTRRETGIYVLYATNTVGSIVDHTICRVNVTIQYGPECRDGSPNYIECEDAPVTMECLVDAVPPINSVTWREEGQILNVSSTRYSGGDFSNPSLTINRLIESDSGRYECQVGNVVGTAVCPKTLEVPSKPVVNVTRTNIVLIEGQTSSLGCSVDMRTNPTPVVVHWFKNGFRIESNSGRYQHGDLNIPSLTISNIQREDAGVYSCSAINSIGDRKSSNIVVTVEYPPVVKVPYNNYGFPLDTDATLWCSVDANPPVDPSNITWVVDGRLTIPSTYCINPIPNLQVCSVQPTSAGLYRCRAIHRLATKHSEGIRVHVRDECPLVIEEVRLVDGPSSGRVEVRIGATWGTVCGRYWNPLATQAVCRMFNYSYGSSSMDGAGTGPIHIGHVRCGTGATTLGDCGLTSISNCTHQEDIWVQCSSSPITSAVEAITTTEAPPTICQEETNGYQMATAVFGVLFSFSFTINLGFSCKGKISGSLSCLAELWFGKKITMGGKDSSGKSSGDSSSKKDANLKINLSVGKKSGKSGKSEKSSGKDSTSNQDTESNDKDRGKRGKKKAQPNQEGTCGGIADLTINVKTPCRRKKGSRSCKDFPFNLCCCGDGDLCSESSSTTFDFKSTIVEGFKCILCGTCDGENNPGESVDDESGESVDDESGESVDNKSGESVDNKSGESVEDKSGESVEDQSGESVEDQSGESVEDQSGESVEDQSGESVEDQSVTSDPESDDKTKPNRRRKKPAPRPGRTYGKKDQENKVRKMKRKKPEKETPPVPSENLPQSDTLPLITPSSAIQVDTVHNDCWCNAGCKSVRKKYPLDEDIYRVIDGQAKKKKRSKSHEGRGSTQRRDNDGRRDKKDGQAKKKKRSKSHEGRGSTQRTDNDGRRDKEDGGFRHWKNKRSTNVNVSDGVGSDERGYKDSVRSSTSTQSTVSDSCDDRSYSAMDSTV